LGTICQLENRRDSQKAKGQDNNLSVGAVIQVDVSRNKKLGTAQMMAAVANITPVPAIRPLGPKLLH
jgi:hypothetical protein